MPITELRKRKKEIISTTSLQKELPEVKVMDNEKKKEYRVHHRKRVLSDELEQLISKSTASRELMKAISKVKYDEIDEIKVVDRLALKKLKSIWRKFPIYSLDYTIQEYFDLSLKILSGLDVNQEVIQEFIYAGVSDIDFTKYEEQQKISTFLTALIANSSEENITLDVRNLPPLNYLCCFLDKPKKITIVGDVGDYTAYGANSGMIIVKGNAGNETGNSVKGSAQNMVKIMIEGSTGDYSGHNAKYCKIIIKGNAGNCTGSRLQEGSEIVVKGNAGNFTGMMSKGGKIKVHGDVGKKTGEYLNGGRIEIEGNAGDATASNAVAGEIHVNGNIKCLGYNISSNVKIFERGKRVWPRVDTNYITPHAPS